MGLSLGGSQGLQAAPSSNGARAKSVIMVYCGGGISHHDSFDPKPDAPAEVRGEFSTVSDRRLPGVFFTELLPRLARQAVRFTLIRSVHHDQTNHGVSAYFMQRGYTEPDPSFDGPDKQPRSTPNIGSQVARLHGSTNGLPPYMCVPGLSDLAQVGYYTAGWMGRGVRSISAQSGPERPKLPGHAAGVGRDCSDPADRAALEPATGVMDHWTRNHEKAALQSVDDNYLSALQTLTISAHAGPSQLATSRQPSAMPMDAPKWVKAASWHGGWWKRASPSSQSTGYGPCMAEVYAAFCRVSWDMWTRAWIGWVLRGVRVRA